MAQSLRERLRAKRALEPRIPPPPPPTFAKPPPPPPVFAHLVADLTLRRREPHFPLGEARASAAAMKRAGWQMDHGVDHQGRLR